jgi:hypothetical protein
MTTWYAKNGMMRFDVERGIRNRLTFKMEAS